MDSHGDRHRAPSNSELFSSAKVIGEAAQSTFSHGTDKIDRAKVARAAGDLLDAASKYGKLDEKGLGKYVDKAGEYLHQYSSPGSKSAGSHGGGGQGRTESHGEGGYGGTGSHGEGGHGGGQGRTESHGEGGYGGTGSHGEGGHGGGQGRTESHGDGGGGFSDYLNMAQGFMKKN
ncbi:hypothetical protein L6164_027040 [Bauhinia variegata]|uniref:Uncharacterized protein n=1 Tax=Bauhinia variegata TaxID=167791 RepID=A0ACB9LSP6_BAUVA|nr:hypothetical protein L6164_027040 [Bauhinia variegata]